MPRDRMSLSRQTSHVPFYSPSKVEDFWQGLDDAAGHDNHTEYVDHLPFAAYTMRNPSDEPTRVQNAEDFEAAVLRSEKNAVEYRVTCEEAQQLWKKAWANKNKDASLMAPDGPLAKKLKHAITLDPERPEAFQILAQVLERIDVADALQCHLTAMDLSDPDTHGWAASVAGAFGCLVHPLCEEARKEVEWWEDGELKELSHRVVQVDPKSGAAQQMRGDVLEGKLGLWEPCPQRSSQELFEAERALYAAAERCPDVLANMLSVEKLKQRAKECNKAAKGEKSAELMRESYAQTPGGAKAPPSRASTTTTAIRSPSTGYSKHYQ